MKRDDVTIEIIDGQPFYVKTSDGVTTKLDRELAILNGDPLAMLDTEHARNVERCLKERENT